MKVRDIMTQPPQTCHVYTDMATASRRMRETGCGSLAVLDVHGRLVGILTDRDLAIAVGDRTHDVSCLPVDKAMTHRVHTCAPEDEVQVALDRMASAKVRRLPVVDDGDLTGMISIDDIVLWGVQHGGVSMHALTHALRSICAPSVVRPEAQIPHF